MQATFVLTFKCCNFWGKNLSWRHKSQTTCVFLHFLCHSKCKHVAGLWGVLDLGRGNTGKTTTHRSKISLSISSLAALVACHC